VGFSPGRKKLVDGAAILATSCTMCFSRVIFLFGASRHFSTHDILVSDIGCDMVMRGAVFAFFPLVTRITLSDSRNRYADLFNRSADSLNCYNNSLNRYADLFNLIADLLNRYTDLFNRSADSPNCYNNSLNCYADLFNRISDSLNRYNNSVNRYAIEGSLQ